MGLAEPRRVDTGEAPSLESQWPLDIFPLRSWSV